MCGIAGIVGDQLDLLHENSFFESISSRGPDKMSIVSFPKCIFGSSRLVVNGHVAVGQPIYSQCGRVVSVVNGEIYNYKELARKYRIILQPGASDCHLVSDLFVRGGPSVFSEIDGVFAIALYDLACNKFYLFRDSNGEAPLYFSHDEASKTLVFSSTLKSFFSLKRRAELNRSVSPSLAMFLWVPQPHTVIEGVNALLPGNALIWHCGVESAPEMYSYVQARPNSNDGEISIEQELEVAIRTRLSGNAPTGLLLSGGLDSGSIAAFSAHMQKPLKGYTVGFEGYPDLIHGSADETGLAEIEANKYGIDLTKIKISPDRIESEFQSFIENSDQPNGVSSGIGINALARSARADGIKVLLTGDGADELFGGYSWYVNLCRNRGSKCSINQYLESHYYMSKMELNELFCNLIVEKFNDWIDDHLKQFLVGDSQLEQVLRADRKFYFRNEMLRKADGYCMANGIEARAPFASNTLWSRLDPRSIFELVESQSYRIGCKPPLRNIYKKFSGGCYSRGKQGFNVPISFWLLNELSSRVDDTFRDMSLLVQQGILKPGLATNVKSRLADNCPRFGHAIFSLVSLNEWWMLNDKGNS